MDHGRAHALFRPNDVPPWGAASDLPQGLRQESDGRMLEALELKSGDRVFEVGINSGYNTVRLPERW